MVYISGLERIQINLNHSDLLKNKAKIYTFTNLIRKLNISRTLNRIYRER